MLGLKLSMANSEAQTLSLALATQLLKVVKVDPFQDWYNDTSQVTVLARFCLISFNSNITVQSYLLTVITG